MKLKNVMIALAVTAAVAFPVTAFALIPAASNPSEAAAETRATAQTAPLENNVANVAAAAHCPNSYECPNIGSCPNDGACINQGNGSRNNASDNSQGRHGARSHGHNAGHHHGRNA